MKKTITIFVTLILVNCQYTKSKIKKQDCTFIKDTIEKKYSDNLIKKYSLKDLEQLHDLKEVKVYVNYHAHDSVGFYIFKFGRDNFRIVKDSCKYNENLTSLFFMDNYPVQKHIVYVKDSVNFGFDNLMVDYNRSTFYTNLKKDLLLIKNIEERLSGRANNWNYYQLIDIKQKEMYEFYLFDNK
jgi:hypothetical protein